MKIDSEQMLATVNKFKNEPVEKNETAAAGPDKASRPGTGSDRIELSRNSMDIERLKKTLEVAPDFRSDKVSELRDRIAAGSYHVEGKKVAEKMLQSWRELHGL